MRACDFLNFVMDKVLFSSQTDNWSTPQWLFDELNEFFYFNLDPCADEYNHKCKFYFTKEVNGLDQDWQGFNVFCNPPFSQLKKWVKKCFDESRKPGTLVVMLIPARTDTSYFHDYIFPYATIRFLRGRLKFGNSKNFAPFPSCIVVFK